MARSVLGVDIGATGIRAVAGSAKKDVFKLEGYFSVPFEEGAEPDFAAAGRELAALLKNAKISGSGRFGLTGRDVVLRYTQVPPVPDWQLRQLMDFEIKELAEQSGESLAADFNLIPVASDVGSDDTVLLALAKPAILESHGQVVAHSGVALDGFTPNAVALLNAYRKAGAEDGTTLILNVGARNTDVAIVKNGDLLFARNQTGGGDLFDEALAASFNVSKTKAQQLKHEMADVAPPDPNRKKASSAQAEKVNRALAGAIGQLFSMVQSSVMFAKTQTGQNEVKLDRVMLCGGGGLLNGLDRYLEQNLGVPVKRFDPFDAIDLGTAGGDIEEPEERAAAVVALGLALTSAFPNSYTIDILPESAKKARRFKERTVFVILAVVVAVLALGIYAYRAQTDFEAASSDLRTHASEFDKLNKRKADSEQKTKLREETSRRLVALEEHSVIGLGATRTLALMQKYLPPDLYVTSITSPRVKDPVLGIVGDPRPVLVVKGEGREGAEGIASTFNRFVEALIQDPLVPQRPTSKTAAASGKKKFEWEIAINFAQPQAAPAAKE